MLADRFAAAGFDERIQDLAVELRIVIGFEFGREEAGRWLQIACRRLPGGSWREYLAREFSGAEVPCADEQEDQAESYRTTKP